MDLGQVSNPGFNFASMYGQALASVHMSVLLPWGNFERQVICSSAPGSLHCCGNLFLCEQRAKVPKGQE